MGEEREKKEKRGREREREQKSGGHRKEEEKIEGGGEERQKRKGKKKVELIQITRYGTVQYGRCSSVGSEAASGRDRCLFISTK